MNAHTPGPWFYRPDGTGCAAHVEGQSIEGYNYCIATCNESYSDAINYPTAQANARLVAAAPELLAALEDSSTLMDEVASWLTGDESFSFETLAEGLAQQAMKAREAIAKAKGQP